MVIPRSAEQGLQCLVEFLFADTREVVFTAMETFSRLSKKHENEWCFLNLPSKWYQKVVMGLCDANNFDLVAVSLEAVHNLACLGSEARTKIVEQRGCIGRLVWLLKQNNALSKMAARTLYNVSSDSVHWEALQGYQSDLLEVSMSPSVCARLASRMCSIISQKAAMAR